MVNVARRGARLGIGLAGALFALAAAAADGSNYLTPGSKATGLSSCVERTDYMRRNHMEVIKHQRDETVHKGIRSTKHSLSGCIDCHVSYGADAAPVPVDAEGQFCIACHGFAAVGMNCFGCHAGIPSQRPSEPAAQTSQPVADGHQPHAVSSSDDSGLNPEKLREGDHEQ